jgi:hypothetical protein
VDEARIDGLARSLGAVRSRRVASLTLAGGTLAGLLTGAAGNGASAKKKKKCTLKCKAGQIEVDGQCVTGQGTCAPGANTCPAGPLVQCNGAKDCTCFQSTSGATRCGKDPIGIQCGQCTSDAQCAAFGPGSFCVTTTAPNTNCTCGQEVGKGFCQLPC